MASGAKAGLAIAAVALLGLPILLVTLAAGEETADNLKAAAAQIWVDDTTLPPLARQLLPDVITDLDQACPQLPPVLVFAEVQAESSWRPDAWSNDSNGGAAGLYQINQANWIFLGGHPWGVPAGQRPPPDHGVFDPGTNLRLGIRLVCGHLDAMATYLLDHPEKTIDPLTAVLVCHIAGCRRVVDSQTGIPRPGEAGCDQHCVNLTTNYLAAVRHWTEAFTTVPGTVGGAGPQPMPPGIGIAGLPAPTPNPFHNQSGCTQPDPTGGRCVTPTVAYGLTQIQAVFGSISGGPNIRAAGCWDPHPQNPSSDHPRGMACDFFPGVPGQFASGRPLLDGWTLAAWLRANATALDVKYLIWQGRIWSPGTRDEDGWGTPYDGGGIYDVHDATGGHYDHVHVSWTH